MPYRRTPQIEQRLADTRQRIVRATRQLIGKGGFRDTSMVSLAQAVEISTGALYRYFPSKAGLLVEVLDDAVTREIGVLQTIIDGPGSAPERLHLAVAAFARRTLRGPYLAYAFLAEPIDPEVDSARIKGRERFAEVFQALLSQGIEAGEFAPQPVEVTAACIVGAFTEALVRPVMSHRKGRDEAALIDGIADFCVRAAGGIRTPAARADPIA